MASIRRERINMRPPCLQPCVPDINAGQKFFNIGDPIDFIFVYSLVEHETLKYGTYDFPDWADAVGWGLASVSMLQIPFWAVVAIFSQPGDSLKEKFLRSLKPTEEWGPSDDLMKDYYKSLVDGPGPVAASGNEHNTSVRPLTQGGTDTDILEYL